MSIWQRPSYIAVFVGAGAVLASAFLPWVTARTTNSTIHVVPASTDLVQASVWVLVACVTGGVVLFAARANPAIVGAGTTAWLTFSTVVWMFGAQIVAIVPSSVLPDNAAVRLGSGASIGLVGGVVAVIGTVMVLAERTFALSYVVQWSWSAPAALLIGAALIWSRQIPWVRVEGAEFVWKFDFSIVPLIGDLIGLCYIAVIVLLSCAVLRPRRWVAWAIGGAACALAVLAVVAFVSWAFVDRIVGEVLERSGVLDAVDGELSAGPGPLVVLVVAAALVVFAVIFGRQFDTTDPTPAAA